MTPNFVKAELSATRERLKLSSDLQKTQEDYIRARKLSDVRRNLLSTVSHDLQQPLASLRLALVGLRNTDERATQNMHSAFDYLESLAVEHLQETKQGDEAGSASFADVASEVFPIKLVLDNVHKMFKDEAIEKSLDFRCRPISANVPSDPVTLMRAINNLVANAIKHTDSGGVLLCARKRQGSILLQVWDTGYGLGEDELRSVMQPNVKGVSSDGHGLGLGIVQSISEQLNLNFELNSRVDRGTVASLKVDYKE